MFLACCKMYQWFRTFDIWTHLLKGLFIVCEQWLSIIQVAKIDIDYAKTAKKLDVKRLKSSMWSLMKSAPVEKVNCSFLHKTDVDIMLTLTSIHEVKCNCINTLSVIKS